MTVQQNASTVICPKCGYAQEERLDCMKCGIVFSKYYALYGSSRSSQPEASELPLQGFAEEGFYGEAGDPRQNTTDFQHLMNSLEFERVERNKIYTDLKILEKKIHSNQDEMESRLADLEKVAIGTFPLSPPPASENLAEFKRDLLDVHFEPLVRRMEELEQKIAAAPGETVYKTDPKVLDVLRRFEVRVADLEAKLSGVGVDNTQNAYAELEKAVEGSAQEIAELKESMEHSKEARQAIAQRVDSGLAEMDSRLQESAASVSQLEEALGSVSENLRQVDAQHQSLAEELVTTIEKTKDFPEQTALLMEDVLTLRTDLEALRIETHRLQEKLAEVQSHLPEEPRSPMDEDVRAIRQNIEQLLRYVGNAIQREA